VQGGHSCPRPLTFNLEGSSTSVLHFKIVNMTENRHIHLIGICGTAMASLAGMLQQRGFRVTGSDAAAYPPMSDFLASLGIPLSQPFAEQNLQPKPDLVVVGNAISRGNVELEHILDQRIPFCSLPQILHDEFLRGKEVLVVAGTHGKTTTTSMLAWIFHTAGLQPSFLIGGIAENFGSSFQLGQGKHFILEGDEYDTAFFDKGPKFLHYFPDSIILTSVEFDHADIYKDLDAVETAFKRLVNLIPRRGRIIAFDSGVSLERCLSRAFCPVERYGSGANATWRIDDLHLEPGRTAWSVFRDGELWAEFEYPVAGEYNVWNATAAAAMAAGCGIRREEIAAALKTFKSVKRRLEVRAKVNGITIVDDFAHHPTAIAGTLTALRSSYPGARLWAILEPRSNTLRRNVLQNELAKSLALADEIVVANVFKSEAIPEAERLDLATVAAQIQKHGRRARIVPTVEGIVQLVAPEMRSGDVVAILSNGGFGGIYEKLPERLKSLGPNAQQAPKAEKKLIVS
jgi:UDP-N-acetylmuramate: L-alanyl-gamma-D-glutamyl-meso-diaminopimelate ligase